MSSLAPLAEQCSASRFARTGLILTTKLSVNLNKIALLRNARAGEVPSLTDAARRVLDAGAAGITVHPRPDLRHIRPRDVSTLAALIAKEYPDREFNIEGNPGAGANALGYPGFMEILLETRPTQATLVPDSEDQLTSDHGWDLPRQCEEIAEQVTRLRASGTRVSLFMDATGGETMSEVARIGAERIEIYTGPYAEAHQGRSNEPERFDRELGAYVTTAKAAQENGLGVNAGHDLNLDNLSDLVMAHAPLEVSIGHAFTADALVYGLAETVRRYMAVLK